MSRRSRQLRPAFTLLETVLAVVLGSLVVLAALALFTTIDQSNRRSERQLERNMELATAHSTIARSFHMLLMSSEQPPNEKDTEEFLKRDDERNAEDALDREDEDAASTRLALQPDTRGGFTMRIGPEGRQRSARSQRVTLTLRDSPILSDGQKTPEEQAAEQIRREKYLLRGNEKLAKRIGASGSSRGSSASGSSSKSGGEAGGALGEALAAADQAAGGGKSAEGRGSRRAESGGRTSGGSRSSAGKREDGGRELALRPRGAESGRGSSGGSRDDRTASERLADEEEERPRAPGVRGVFELLPDGAGDDTSDGTGLRRRLTESDVPTFSLWWRELPPLEIDADSDVSAGADNGEESDNSGAALSESRTRSRTGDRKADSRTASERAAASRGGSGIGGASVDRQVAQLANSAEGSGKRVRLLSGLTACHWTALRGRKERDKITAKFDRHLPAFVELEIVTVEGRRENWVFDVAWTVGPEPGSILPESLDPLNGGPPGGDGGDGGGVDLDGDGVPDGPGTGGGAGGGKGGGKGGSGKDSDINPIVPPPTDRSGSGGRGGAPRGPVKGGRSSGADGKAGR